MLNSTATVLNSLVLPYVHNSFKLQQTPFVWIKFRNEHNIYQQFFETLFSNYAHVFILYDLSVCIFLAITLLPTTWGLTIKLQLTIDRYYIDFYFSKHADVLPTSKLQKMFF
jgi:hypothetical protein